MTGSEETNNELFGEPDIADLLSHIDDDLVEERRNWPRDLCEISDFLHNQLKLAGLDDARHATIADKLLTALAIHSGGRGFYLPKADRVSRFIRNRKIYREFTGHNHRELVAKYKLSEVKIYQIIKEQRAAEVARIQPGLFTAQ